MNQEQIGLKLGDVSRVTGELILKALAYMVENGADKIQTAYDNRSSLKGEIKWEQLLNADTKKEVIQFRQEEVNLDRLKEQLQKDNVRFAFKKEEGVHTLLFEAKNTALVKQALETIIDNLTNPAKAQKFNQMILKSPKNMSIEERLQYYKQEGRAQIAKLQAERAKKLKAPKVKER